MLLVLLAEKSAFSANDPIKPKEENIKGPKTANDYFHQGFIAATSGRYDTAIKCYNVAIGLDPNRIYFYYHRALAYKAIGDKSQAVAEFNRCLSMKPIAEAYYELAVYKYDELDITGAKDYFEKAKSLKDDIDKLNYYLGVINYRLNKYDSAEALLTHYTNIIKTNSDAFLYLAMVKVKLLKYDEVNTYLRFATLYNDNDWKLHLKMYDIYKEMGDKENMLAHISMVIEMGQTKSEYYTIRAQLYEERGDNLLASYDYMAAKAIK